MSITYELALKLKNAGFPGSEHWRDNRARMGKDYGMEMGEVEPSLEDIIKACGDRFNNLAKVNRKYRGFGKYEEYDPPIWVCGWSTNGANDLDDKWEQEGKTPEEAVANLWLFLNKLKT